MVSNYNIFEIKWFDEFLSAYKIDNVIRPSAADVEAYRGKLPDFLLRFWSDHGWCSWSGGQYWLCNPSLPKPVLDYVFLGDPEKKRPIEVNSAQEELSEAIYDKVTLLSEQGNDLLDRGDAKAAISIWRSALKLLPEPRRKWDAAVWLHASIGDAQREDGDLIGALESFQQAAASGDGFANSFVQLGLGTCLYDLGRKEESTDPLLRAYMGEGEEIFEDSDSKYLGHLRGQKLID